MWLAILLSSLACIKLPSGTIVLTVTKFENNKGNCIACLYDNAASFSGKGLPVVCKTVPVDKKGTTVVFDDVPNGVYAISVIHDANRNEKFDTNFLGIPKEGYGASKNNLPFAAAPDFHKNKFSLSSSDTATISIQLRYLF